MWAAFWRLCFLPRLAACRRGFLFWAIALFHRRIGGLARQIADALNTDHDLVHPAPYTHCDRALAFRARASGLDCRV